MNFFNSLASSSVYKTETLQHILTIRHLEIN